MAWLEQKGQGEWDPRVGERGFIRMRPPALRQCDAVGAAMRHDARHLIWSHASMKHPSLGDLNGCFW